MESPLFVLAAFLVLSLFMTFPLVLRFASHAPAGAVDLWQNVWNFWWWKQCLLTLHQGPYWTGHLFYPTGANAAFHTHSVFNMLAAFPVTLTLGEVAAYNFSILLALWLSGFTMWLLAREVTRNGAAAFIAGVVFAYLPNHMEQTLEHLNLFSTQFIPLAIFFLIRLVRAGGRWNWIGFGLAYALNALADWHLAIKLSVLLTAILAYLMVRAPRSRLRVLLDVAQSAALALVLVLPAAWPLLRQMLGVETFFMKPREDKGIDVLFLLLPYFNHSIWGGLTREAYARRAYEAAGFASFLGYLPLLLALAGCVLRLRRSWPWLVLFLISLLLSLGKHPYVNGHLYTNVNLPFGWMETLPLLRLLRVANRFMIFAGLGLAMLSAWGWCVFARAPRWGGLLAAGFILVEFLWIPYPLREVVRPQPLKSMARDLSTGAVLDLPFMLNGQTVENMRNQTIHGRPIVGGYLSTLPPAPADYIAAEPALSDLMGLEPALSASVNLDRLSELGIRFIVLHKDRTESYAAAHKVQNPPSDLFQRKLDTRLGGMSDEKFARLRLEIEAGAGPPWAEDDQLVVFRLGGEGGGASR